jgi:mxaA protein
VRQPPATSTGRRYGVAAALLIAVLLTVAPPAGRAADTPAVVQQPRSYGHLVGDVLTQRILLEESAGHALLPVLPPAARVNAYLDRLPARVETDGQGRGWLRLDYQVINAPRDLMQDTIPALAIATKSGATLTVPEWPVSIGPLTPDAVYAKGDLQSMRPDQLAAPYSTAAPRQALLRWGALLLLTLLAWAGWLAWRNARDTARMPFARAQHEVARLQRQGRLDGAEGWVSMHRAFNRAAGRVVQPESLPVLFERAPYLAPLRADIEHFFQASSERFFARSPTASPAVSLAALSRQLRAAEKRGASGRGV